MRAALAGAWLLSENWVVERHAAGLGVGSPSEILGSPTLQEGLWKSPGLRPLRPNYGLAAEGTRLAQRGLSCWSPGSPRSGDVGTGRGEADLGNLSLQQSQERTLWVPVRPARFLCPKGKFLLLVPTRAFRGIPGDAGA